MQSNTNWQLYHSHLLLFLMLLLYYGCQQTAMSVNKKARSRVQGSWAAAGTQQKLLNKPASHPVSATDVSKPTFQPNERVTQPLSDFTTFTIAGLENIVIFSKISKMSKISYFLIFLIFLYIYRAFAHTLLKLYEIYYQIIVCVCALHIRWSTLVIHATFLWRGAIWQKLSNTEKMLKAQVINQKNTRTENQNIVTMCHTKIYLKTG